MLKKMLIHGLTAAAVIGAAAAVYAAGRDHADAIDNAAPAVQADTGGRTATGNGYIADGGKRSERDGAFRLFRAHDRDRDDDDDERSEHRRKHHDHDDD